MCGLFVLEVVMVQIKNGRVGKVRINLAMSLNECVGMAIRAIRTDKGLRQADIGICLSVGTSQANKFETGASVLSFTQVYTVAKYLDIKVQDIIDLAELIYTESNGGLYVK